MRDEDKSKEQLVAELQELRARLESVAQIDGLTGLPNRLLFQDRLVQSLNQARRNERHLALLVVDLDRLRLINDSLGHEAGDTLIGSVATCLLSCVRDCDTVARAGGSEFYVLLTEVTDAHSAAIVAKRILSSLARPFLVGDREVLVTASIGISHFPSDGPDATALLRHAHAALSGAKQQGNTYQHYAPSLNAESFERLVIDNGMRKALERGEFLLHYQPRVSFQTGKVVGAEALIRWQHPELGMVSPVRFIPIAEETGLIVPITEWVLQEASARAVAWQEQGHEGLCVSVNLSGRHFRQPNLAAMVTKALIDTGLDPSLLELELTESSLLEGVEQVRKTLSYLHFTGVRFAIDDFGTGYSSFSYLKRMPIQFLKIDRSFIQGLPDSQDDAAIVTAILAMAHRMGMRVVAEGVETAEQLAFLQAAGCDQLQGYYFSPPLPAHEFEALLSTGRVVS